MIKIKEIRTQFGLSQSQFANFVGIPVRTLQSWESGHRKCPESKLTYIIMLTGYQAQPCRN